MWQLLIDKEQTQEFCKSFPDKQDQTKSINEIYTKLGDGIYHARLPASLAFYKNLETNELDYKAYVINNVLHEIPEDLKHLKKEEHILIVSFGISNDKPYMRYWNLPLFVEEV